MEKSTRAYEEFVEETCQELAKKLREGKISRQEYEQAMKSLKNGGQAPIFE